MKIAVASQNRRSVTEHLGRCRRFWVYDAEGGVVGNPTLVELTKEETLHALAPHVPKPLAGLDVVLCAGMGDGMRGRLLKRGISAHITTCESPGDAAASYAAAHP